MDIMVLDSVQILKIGIGIDVLGEIDVLLAFGGVLFDHCNYVY